MFYNYHAKAKRLIAEGHLTEYEVLECYNGISKCLLLYFDDNKPMPIREHRWEEYFALINKVK